MTLAQIAVLFDAERRFHSPPKKGAEAAQGTVADLMMFAAMQVSSG